MSSNRFVLFLCFLALIACDKDSPVDPPPPPPPPTGPKMYNVAGTGVEGFGAAEQLPLDTQLRWPQDIAFTPDSTLVVVDWDNHRVIALDKTTGTFRMLAGSVDGVPGEPCPIVQGPCENGVQDVAYNHPTSVCFRDDGMMVLAAWHNAAMLLVDVAGDFQQRIAGTGRPCYNGDGGPADSACVSFPAASVYDLQGRLVFTDQTNQIIRMIDESGVIHTIAGTAPVWDGTRYIPQAGFTGDEGPATSAKFRFAIPTTCGKLCIDAAGNVYIADTMNHAVRRLDTSGVIHRFAGLQPASAGYSGDGGPATSAKLKEPRDVACDASGNIYICDTGNHVIRMVDATGKITTVAGTGVAGDSSQDGKLATKTTLKLPYGIEIDPLGRLWIADTENSRIRVVY